MSLSTAEIDRFWQNLDQRREMPPGVSEANTDNLVFGWGASGTTLSTIGQPHYRIFLPWGYYPIGWSMIGNTTGSAIVQVERAPALSGGGPGPLTFTDVTGGSPPTLTADQALVTMGVVWIPRTWRQFDALHVYLSSVSGLQELSFQIFVRRLRRVGT